MLEPFANIENTFFLLEKFYLPSKYFIYKEEIEGTSNIYVYSVHSIINKKKKNEEVLFDYLPLYYYLVISIDLLYQQVQPYPRY